MKYPLNNANGDAGEFFVAYMIAKELGWPCRLFDIDIGIDAQVEILNNVRESTGRFVAFQVKTTSAEEIDCRYVSEAQLKYWLSLEIPVFVVLVDLQKEQIYLHLIAAEQEYEKTKKGRRKIKFNLMSDKFSTQSARILADASERLVMSQLNGYLNSVNAEIESILEEVKACDDGNPDPYALIEHMDNRAFLFGKLDQADAASSLSKVGADVIDKCRRRFIWALDDLQNAMRPMATDYADKGDITGFLSEDYPSRPAGLDEFVSGND